MRILILEHEREAPAGLLEEWAAERGHECDVIEVPKLRRWPPPATNQVIVSLGSDCSVHASAESWIPNEIAFVRAAHQAHTPILGICFGAQVLAAALGGRVRRANSASACWRDIRTLDPELIAPGPWFRWHEDVFELPPGAKLLAGSEQEPLAFSHGSSLGLQFHPEVGRSIAESWLDGGREQMSAQGIDPVSVSIDIRRAADGARERATRLFDRIALGW
jgi:GMP synthase-like glutamine amidotransferase